jgi:hypothetical protein
MVLFRRLRGLLVNFQDLKSLMIGVILICGVMLAGPLTSHASAADPFAVAPLKIADAGKTKLKPRLSLVERFGGMVSTPKVSQKSFDLTATAATDFGDWDQDAPR